MKEDHCVPVCHCFSLTLHFFLVHLNASMTAHMLVHTNIEVILRDINRPRLPHHCTRLGYLCELFTHAEAHSSAPGDGEKDGTEDPHMCTCLEEFKKAEVEIRPRENEDAR